MRLRGAPYDVMWFTSGECGTFQRLIAHLRHLRSQRSSS